MIDTLGTLVQSIPIVLVGGTIGAIIGAFANAYLRHRSDRKAARQDLVGNIASFTQEALGALTELYAATLAAKNDAERWKAKAKFMTIYGRGLALETLVFRDFRNRLVRSGFHRILSRLEKLRDEIDGDEVLDSEKFQLGIQWVDNEMARTLSVMSAGAGMEMTDRGRLVFVGFRRITPEFRRSLSFDDFPPPWVFDVRLDFERERPNEEEEKMIKGNLRRKVGEMRCPEHGYAAQITLHGKTMKNFSIEVGGCCQEFIKAVYGKATG